MGVTPHFPEIKAAFHRLSFRAQRVCTTNTAHLVLPMPLQGALRRKGGEAGKSPAYPSSTQLCVLEHETLCLNPVFHSPWLSTSFISPQFPNHTYTFAHTHTKQKNTHRYPLTLTQTQRHAERHNRHTQTHTDTHTCTDIHRHTHMHTHT